MARHPKADFDPEQKTTGDLLDYINRVGPIAAKLPTGEYAEPVLAANVRTAVDELHKRRDDDETTDDSTDARPTDDEVAFGETVDDFAAAASDAVETVADGGKSVDDFVDDAFDPDASHYLRDVERDEYDVKLRHDGVVETTVDDDTGCVIHNIVETYDDDADGDTLSWSYGAKCPIHGRDFVTSDRERDADAGETRITHTCDPDDETCPYTATQVQVAGFSKHDDADLPGYGDPDYERPLFFRATVPHDFDDSDETFDPETYDDLAAASEHDEVAETAAVFRRLSLSRHVENIRDAAYVKAEYDDDEKVADAHIETFDCEICGETHDGGTDESHPAVDGDVCRDCADKPQWSVDDADVPDAVDDLFDSYKSITPDKVVSLLRDVRYYSKSTAAFDDDADVDETPATCPTGKQGTRRVQGRGSPGTGLRRPDGVAHGDAQWRVVLRKCRDAGLIERADDGDVDFDNHAAKWSTTDRGDDVFDALARCKWCGERKTAVAHKYTVKLSRYNTTTNYGLVLSCPCGCDGDPKGKTVDLPDPDE